MKKRCGCPRKQWPKCAHSWHLGFHYNGREWRLSLDVLAEARGVDPPRSVTEAKGFADLVRSEIRAGVS